MLTEEADRQARSRRRRWPHRPGFTGDLFGEHNRLEMLLHRVSVLPDESLIVALLSSLIVALQPAAREGMLIGQRPFFIPVMNRLMSYRRVNRDDSGISTPKKSASGKLRFVVKWT